MNNFETLISGNKPVLVDFYADWCNPCRMMGPVLDEVKSKVGDDAVVIKINVDENQALCAQYGVRSIPALFIFKQGQVVWQAVGVQRSTVLVDALRQNA